MRCLKKFFKNQNIGIIGVIFFILTIIFAILTFQNLLSHDNIDFHDYSITNKNYEIYMLLALTCFAIVLICYIIHFILALMSNKPLNVLNKIWTCIILYSSTVIIFTISVAFFDLITSYVDKCDEFVYYSNIVMDDKENITVFEPNNGFLDGRDYAWYKKNTMYDHQEGKIHQNFKDMIKSHKVTKDNLQELIGFDTSNILNNIFELFYFSITIISTLGFGDITPTTGTAKLFVSVYICIGQFITILMVAKIFGQTKT